MVRVRKSTSRSVVVVENRHRRSASCSSSPSRSVVMVGYRGRRRRGFGGGGLVMEGWRRRWYRKVVQRMTGNRRSTAQPLNCPGASQGGSSRSHSHMHGFVVRDLSLRRRNGGRWSRFLVHYSSLAITISVLLGVELVAERGLRCAGVADPISTASIRAINVGGTAL